MLFYYLLWQFFKHPLTQRFGPLHLYLSSIWSANFQKTLIRRPITPARDEGKKNWGGKRKIERAIATGLNVSHYLLQDLGICPTHKHHKPHPESGPLLHPALCGRSLTGSNILG